MNAFHLDKTILYLIIGPMRGEKTTEAIRIASKYTRYCNVIFVNPRIDIRSSNGVVKSRNGIEFTCINVDRLEELESNPEFKAADICVLDESQFFSDLKEHVEKWCDQKSYVISSLDADYEQKKFGQIWDLIPLADKVKKMKALCEICKDGTQAVCTIATGEMDGQIAVDGKNGSMYISVCRKHRKK